MISNPKHGWCNFRLGNFEGTPSYLIDVPFELLQAFIDYHERGSSAIVFDEEGTEFTLILTSYFMDIYIIENRGTAVLYDFSEMRIENLEKELISDIENDLYGWAEFCFDKDDETIKFRREQLLQKIACLKKYIK